MSFVLFDGCMKSSQKPLLNSKTFSYFYFKLLKAPSECFWNTILYYIIHPTHSCHTHTHIFQTWHLFISYIRRNSFETPGSLKHIILNSQYILYFILQSNPFFVCYLNIKVEWRLKLTGIFLLRVRLFFTLCFYLFLMPVRRRRGCFLKHSSFTVLSGRSISNKREILHYR